MASSQFLVTQAELSRFAETSTNYRRLASSIKLRWEVEGRPDALAAMQEHPELSGCKAIALELAYEEFWQRIQAGEEVDPDAFCDKFSHLRRTLRRLLSLQHLVGDSQSSGAKTRASLVPGERLLDFQILDELGRGAFAAVYLAQQTSLGNRLVAIKVSADPGDEANVLGKLEHPNIVPAYSVNRDGPSGCSVICMPYLGQATLADALDHVFSGKQVHPTGSVFSQVARASNTVPIAMENRGPSVLCGSYLETVIHVGIQLADALAHAHARGIVHRDLKPSNVLLAFDGRPMILDFNLSSDREVELPRIGGTLPYMSPEQIEAVASCAADASSVDAASDIFALGAILYELSCGRSPFSACTKRLSTASLQEHLEARRRFTLDQFRDTAVIREKAIVEVISRCLSYEVAGRPQSALELRQLLQRQLSPSRRLRRWAASRRKWLGTGACLGLAIVFSIVCLLASREPYATRELKAAISEFEAGQFAPAADRLNAVILRHPELDDAYLARARLRCRIGQIDRAYDDFEVVHSRRPSPYTAACKAYCLSVLGHHVTALKCLSAAIEEGFESPAVLNNSAWSLLKLGRLAEAKAQLSRAIELDPRLQPAYANRAAISFQESLNAGQPKPETEADLSQALALGPVAGEHYLNLAHCCAMKTRSDPSFGKQVMNNLEYAIDLGFNPTEIAKDPLFTRIANVVDLDPLYRRKRGDPSRFLAPHIVGPDALLRSFQAQQRN